MSIDAKAMAAAVEALADSCRAKGVFQVKVIVDEMEIALSLGPAPIAPRAPSEGDDPVKDKAFAAWMKKHARLRRDLGRVPTDDEMEALP